MKKLCTLMISFLIAAICMPADIFAHNTTMSGTTGGFGTGATMNGTTSRTYTYGPGTTTGTATTPGTTANGTNNLGGTATTPGTINGFNTYNTRTNNNNGILPDTSNYTTRNYRTRNTDNGVYRTRAANTNDDNTDWGWLGLIGLVGLAGLWGRNRNPETDR